MLESDGPGLRACSALSEAPGQITCRGAQQRDVGASLGPAPGVSWSSRGLSVKWCWPCPRPDAVPAAARKLGTEAKGLTVRLLQASTNLKRVENIAKRKLDSLMKEAKIRDCEDPSDFTASTLPPPGKLGHTAEAKKVGAPRQAGSACSWERGRSVRFLHSCAHTPARTHTCPPKPGHTHTHTHTCMHTHTLPLVYISTPGPPGAHTWLFQFSP